MYYGILKNRKYGNMEQCKYKHIENREKVRILKKNIDIGIQNVEIGLYHRFGLV